MLEAAIDFTKCERHYLQLGCKVPETPSDPDYAGLLTLIDNARELAGAMPPDATKQVETLFKRHLVSLVSTLPEGTTAMNDEDHYSELRAGVARLAAGAAELETLVRRDAELEQGLRLPGEGALSNWRSRLVHT